MSLHLAKRAAAGDSCSEVQEWIRAGLARYLTGESLDIALRLDRVSLLQDRNTSLLAAAAQIDSGGGAWVLAGHLEKAILRFETRVAPLLRREPAHELAPLDRLLADAFATGQRIPRTQRKLYELLR